MSRGPHDAPAREHLTDSPGPAAGEAGFSARLSRALGALGGQRQVASTSVTAVASQLLLAVAGVFAARQLGPDGRGLVTGVLAWAQALPLLAVAGLNSALLLRISESDGANLGRALGNALAYALVVGGGTGVVALAIVPSVVGGLGHDARFLSSVTMVLIPVGILNELLFAMLVATGRIGSYNLSRVLSPLMLLIGTLVLYVVHAITPTSVVLVTIGGSLLATVVAARPLPWRHVMVHRAQLIADIRFGLKVAVAGWIGFVNVRLDVLVMSSFVAAAQIGFYGVANNAMIPVTTIAASAAGLLTPAVARLALTDQRRSTAQVALIRKQALRYTALAFGGGVFLASIAPLAVPLLFGSAFRPAVKLIWILIPGFVARAFYGLVTAGAIGMRRPRVGNTVELISLGGTVTLLPILLPRYQATGAAIASTGAYGLAAIVAAVWLRRATTATAAPVGGA